MRRVLLLGSGLVAGPIVRYFLDRSTFVTIATRTRGRAQALIDKHPNGEAIKWEGDDAGMLARLVDESDVVVSLLPPAVHPMAARACIAAKRSLVTTSYVSPEMAALSDEAKGAGVLLLNEMGVDPGIDHMSAMRIIDDVRDRGGVVESFFSVAGAVPAPESNDNPFGYKFGWSPRGVLLAARSDAKWIENGEVMKTPGENIFDAPESDAIEGVGELEIYPNRDSTQYAPIYGLEGVKTLKRGTYRYPGWSETMGFFRKAGLLDLEERTGLKGRTRKSFFSDFVDPEDSAPPVERLRWLGAFEEEPLSFDKSSPLDVLGSLMESKLVYQKGERDMVVLRHTFRVREADGRAKTIVSTLVHRGDPGGESAVARTVSLPAAIGARMILEGRLSESGVLVPTQAKVYEPVLKELESFGVRFIEETR